MGPGRDSDPGSRVARCKGQRSAHARGAVPQGGRPERSQSRGGTKGSNPCGATKLDGPGTGFGPWIASGALQGSAERACARSGPAGRETRAQPIARGNEGFESLWGHQAGWARDGIRTLDHGCCAGKSGRARLCREWMEHCDYFNVRNCIIIFRKVSTAPSFILSEES